MEKVKFTVYGEPKGKGRPRFNTKTGHAMTPKDTVSYENLVKLEWQTAYGTESFPKEAMLDMRIKAYYRIPKSASKKKRAAMLAGEIRPTKKPDMDNVVKIIADSKYVQISAGEIAIYDYGVSSSKKRAVFDESGNHFYRDGYYVGCIGTNQWSGNNAHKGLV